MRGAFPTLLCLLLASAACGPRVGDDCQSNFECGGLNTCDVSPAVPDGYCTQTPCRTVGCPDDEAVCILFMNGESYCMLECGASDECREGHRCISAAASSACEDEKDATYPCVASGGSSAYCYARSEG